MIFWKSSNWLSCSREWLRYWLRWHLVMEMSGWLSNSHSPHRGTSDYGYENPLRLYTGVAQVHLPVTGIHMRVALKSIIHRSRATFHHSRWMDDCEVCHGSVEAIPIFDSVDVEEAYHHIASRYHSIQFHVQSHGWRDASLGQEKDSVEGRLVLHSEVSSTTAVQILCWCDSIHGHASHFWTYPWSFLEAPIV